MELNDVLIKLTVSHCAANRGVAPESRSTFESAKDRVDESQQQATTTQNGRLRMIWMMSAGSRMLVAIGIFGCGRE